MYWLGSTGFFWGVLKSLAVSRQSVATRDLCEIFLQWPILKFSSSSSLSLQRSALPKPTDLWTFANRRRVKSYHFIRVCEKSNSPSWKKGGVFFRKQIAHFRKRAIRFLINKPQTKKNTRLRSKCYSLTIEKFSLSNLKNACMQFKNRLLGPPEIWYFATDIADLLTLCHTPTHRHPATGMSVGKLNIFNALYAITDTCAKNRRTSFRQRQRYRFRWKATAFLIYRYLSLKQENTISSTLQPLLLHLLSNIKNNS